MESHSTTGIGNIVEQWMIMPTTKEIDQLARVVAYVSTCKNELSTRIAYYDGRGPPFSAQFPGEGGSDH